jgi:type VI secretion system protein ImpK
MMEAMYRTCADVLSLAARLSTARDLPPPDVLQRRIATLFEQMDAKGAEANISKEDLEAARYAIVAFIDEQIFRSPWPGRQQWMLEPLQLTYYNENTAGEQFFTRMSYMEQDPTKAHVLQIFYLCLTLGFQGKYAVRGGEGLVPLMENLAAKLGRNLPPTDNISPKALPPDVGSGRVTREAPIIAIGVAIVLLAVVTFAGLKLVLWSATNDATAAMKSSSGSTEPSEQPRKNKK